MLSFGRVPPPPWLRDAVESFWTLRGHVPERREELLFAEARADLIVDKRGTSGLGPAGRPTVVVAGAFSRPGRVRYGGAIELVGVRFRVGATGIALGIPGRDLADRAARGDELFAGDVRGALRDIADDPRAGVDELAVWLSVARARARRERVSGLAGRALARLATGASPRQVAAELGLSLRTLERAFAFATGLTPQQVAGIVRSQRAVARLLAGRYRSLAELAHAEGYSDQAHATREIKRHTGMTPGALRTAELPFMAGFARQHTVDAPDLS